MANTLQRSEQNYKRRTGNSAPLVVSKAAMRLKRVIEDGKFPEPEYPRLSHGDVRPANLGIRQTTGEMWCFGFDQADWRDPIFDLAKIYLYDWRTDLVKHRQLALALSQDLNLTEQQFERRLRCSMVIECVWGLAYHL